MPNHAAAIVSRVKKMPSMTASSSSNTSISSSNGAIPNEVVCEEEELDFDKWRVRHWFGLQEQDRCLGFYYCREPIQTQPGDACARLLGNETRCPERVRGTPCTTE